MVRCFTTIALAAAALVACGDNRPANRAQLAVDPVAASVPVGRDLALTARYVDEAGATVPGDELTWTSSDPEVAMVTAGADGAAVVHGLALGSAVIAAGADDLEAAAMITVRAGELDRIAIDPPTIEVPDGGCVIATAIATYSDGAARAIIGTEVAWSGNTGVAAIGPDGTVCAQFEGTDRLVARYQGLYADAPVVTVDAIPIAIRIEAPFTLLIDTSLQAMAWLVYSDGNEVEATDQVTWIAHTPAVVRVSPGGLFTAVGFGTAFVEARFGALTSTWQLDVIDVPVESLELDPIGATMMPGDALQITATAVYADGRRVDVTDQATWFPSNPTIVSVSNGLLLAHAVGVAQVSAIFEGVGRVGQYRVQN